MVEWVMVMGISSIEIRIDSNMVLRIEEIKKLLSLHVTFLLSKLLLPYFSDLANQVNAATT
jgi:hypothetical protein